MKSQSLFKPAIYLLFTAALFSCKKEKPAGPSPTLSPGYPNFHIISTDGRMGVNDLSTVVSNDNHLLMCANNNAGTEIMVYKTTKTGSLAWQKSFAAGDDSRAYCIAEAPSHDIFVCGPTWRNYAVNKEDILLVKLNSAGDTLWSKTYGSTETEGDIRMIPTADGNLLVSSFTYGFGADLFGDIYLLKINTDGDTLWTHTYNDPDQETAFHLLQTQNGEFLVTGKNNDASGSNELYLLKVDANGNQLWNQKYGTGTLASKIGNGAMELSDGSLIITGLSSAPGAAQILIMKTDNLGNDNWEKTFSLPGINVASTSIAQQADGNFVMSGYTHDPANGNNDILVLRTNASGDYLGHQKFGDAMYDHAFNLVIDSNGDIIITGDRPGIFILRMNSILDFL